MLISNLRSVLPIRSSRDWLFCKIGCPKVSGKHAAVFGQIARVLPSFKQINQRMCHSELVRNLRPKASNKTLYPCITSYFNKKKRLMNSDSSQARNDTRDHILKKA
jgi:hypothetical protein